MKQMGLTKRIIIVGNKNIQDNYRLQLFDERNLELVNGNWRLVGCTGSKFVNENSRFQIFKSTFCLGVSCQFSMLGMALAEEIFGDYAPSGGVIVLLID